LNYLRIIAPILLATLGACEIQSQASFDAAPFTAQERIERNYQSVYADVVRGSRLCWGSGPLVTAAPAALAVDAQLYPELGYGEVYHYASGTVFLPYVLVRVERSGSGALIKTKTGPAAQAKTLYSDKALRWAQGNVSCR